MASVVIWGRVHLITRALVLRVIREVDAGANLSYL